MEATNDLISWIVLIFVVLGLGALAYITAYLKEEKKQDDYLYSMYAEIWTGHPLDRVYAWYRVIQHLRAWNQDEDLISRARYLMHLEKQKQERRDIDSEAWMINGAGELIKGTVSTNYKFNIEE